MRTTIAFGIIVLIFMLTSCSGTSTQDSDTANTAPTLAASEQAVPENGGATTSENNSSGDGSDTSHETSVIVDDREIMWLGIAPHDTIIESTTWEFDADQLGENEVILSISPSGRHILTADCGEMNLAMRLRTGKNEMGWMLGYISLYTRQQGAYALTSRIDFDAEADPELNDTLATCGEDGVAWNEDETCVLLTASTYNLRQYFRMADADIFLVDFTESSVVNLTGDPERLVDDCKDLTPHWSGNDEAYFIRYELDEQSYTEITLMKIDIESGEQTVIAELTNEGLPTVIYDYEISKDTIYYIQGGAFYSCNIVGESNPPVCVLDMVGPWHDEIPREDRIHPYALWFSSVQVSPDGRWACLTVFDTRIANRDIPLVDSELLPQSDPNSAISVMSNERWIPCHNVLLYDLVNNTLTNPFTDATLRPDVVIVTAATIAPDSGSLLCAVFGDGGAWTVDSFSKTTLYQIRLDDGSFETMRVYNAEIEFMPTYLSWFGNAYVKMSADSPRVIDYMKLVIPTAFTRYSG